MDYSQEEWKDIPQYGGRYQASSLGRIRAVGHPRRINHTFVMKPQKRGSGGYHGVCLYDPATGKARSRYVHTLVAEAFLGPKPDGLQVNHVDGEKHNNRVSNLEYVTQSENRRHCLRTGLQKVGVLTRAQVRDVQALLADYPQSGLSMREIGRRFGTSHETIRCIRLGRRWQCLDD
jgi:hypothetical protein